MVTFWENQDLEKVIKWDHISRTILTEYFELCKNCEEVWTYCIKNYQNIMYGTNRLEYEQKEKEGKL